MNDKATLAGTPRRMLDIDQVLAIVPVSKATLFRMQADGRFPRSRPISPNRNIWYEDEIVDWQNSLPEYIRPPRRRKASL
jgi:predicted DNA-binding transcriptional regulator AlpA